MNDLAKTAGMRRVMNAILTYAEGHDGALPHSRTFKGLTPAEIQDVRLGFRSTCVRQVGEDRMHVNVDRILIQDFGNEPQRLKDAWYRHCQRIPRDLNAERRERVQALLEGLGSLNRSPPLARIHAAIREGGHWAEDVAAEDGVDAAIREVQTVATVLHEIPNLKGPERIRDLSARLFHGDTKRFSPEEAAYRRVTDELQELHPDATKALRADGSRAWRKALLELFHVIQNPTEITVLLIGPLEVKYGDEEDLSIVKATRRGHASVLTLEQVNALTAPPPGPALLTVENPTTFNNLAATPLAQDMVIICTDGFPNEATQRLARKIPTNLRAHWGDVDPAGFDIASTIGAGDPNYRIFMDAASVEAHPTRLTPFKPGKAELFESRVTSFDAHAQAAIRACLQRKAFLEQENIPTPVAVARIGARLARAALPSAIRQP